MISDNALIGQLPKQTISSIIELCKRARIVLVNYFELCSCPIGADEWFVLQYGSRLRENLKASIRYDNKRQNEEKDRFKDSMKVSSSVCLFVFPLPKDPKIIRPFVIRGESVH